MAPFADLLYVCDSAWFQKVPGWQEFKGIKVCRDGGVRRKFPEIHTVEATKQDELQPYPRVGWGGNSGFQALNLAAHFGVNKIILVGFDMSVDHGVHWHGPHRNGMNNPHSGNVGRWRRSVDGAAVTLKNWGIEVINASPISTLTAYPKMDLEDAL